MTSRQRRGAITELLADFFCISFLKVLLEMLRSVILRGVLPQSMRYSMSDLAIDMQNMDNNFSVKIQKEIIEENEIKRDTGITTEKDYNPLSLINTFQLWGVDEDL